MHFLTSTVLLAFSSHQIPAPDAVFDYVMGDVLTTIVVELLVTPSQVWEGGISCLGEGGVKITAPPHCTSSLDATLMPRHRPTGPPAGHHAPCAILPGLDSPLSLVPPHHPQVLQPDIMPPVQYSLGWSAFVPFAFISDDGSQAEVAVGVHRYPLGGHAAGMLLRDQPLLDWRALLGDAMMRDVPDPLVEFQLFETGVSCTPVWGGVRGVLRPCASVASLRLVAVSSKGGRGR